MWHNIPQELRERHQWVVAGPSKVPLNPRTGQAASPTDPSTWGTFEEATRCGMAHIGFVLTAADPYCIIDLDNKPTDPASPEELEQHKRILEACVSYTERSASGTGYHIVVKGAIPSGVHRSHVEMYSDKRYMIFTGNVVRAAPIADYQELLDVMYAGMKPAEQVELEEVDGYLTDAELDQMATNAVNGDKYLQLCQGKWQEMGYPSQSEADFALLAILAYYTPDNEQVRRLFRYSMLGRRDKATQNNTYLNRALSKIRAKQAPVVDIAAMREYAEAVALRAKGINQGVPNPLPTPTTPGIHENSTPNFGDTGTRPPPPQALEWPPGLVGEMATYFYQTAVRPVPEIALSAALALTAGVAGRSYNVSGTGLNLYLILLAKTGSGKEGAQTAIDNLVAAVRPQIPMVDQFIGPSAFASGQALIRILDERPCFVSVLGEFGITLQQMCSHEASAPLQMLKKVLLDLYAKSGWTKVLRESAYSDKEKTTKVVQAPNVSIYAESVPESFFEGLDASHIAEGLIPRFCILEYTGPRPPRNPYANCPPPAALVQKFADLVVLSLSTQNNGTVCPISTDAEAQSVLDAFDKYADAKINQAGGTDVDMQLWNRAHLKALKLSAVLAVGCNPHQPTVTAPLARWAINFVTRDVETVATRYRTGDVGRGDSKLDNDLRRVIRIYFESTYDQVKHYGVEKKMYDDKMIPYIYIARRTANLSAFRGDKRGAVGALRSTLQSLLDGGVIVEVPPVQVTQKYGLRSRAFLIGKAWTDAG